MAEEHAVPEQAELIAADPDVVADADSSLGLDDSTSSTASVSSSIMQYRTIQGRTFHSERHNTEYYTPNDEQQRESIDIAHHYLTKLLDGKLFLAPIGKDVQKVVDIGTGTGIWAIDFADEFVGAEVIGTDLSPIQPSWVPPNLRFEIDDATQQWTWGADTFDFVHMRYLFGAIADWDALMAEAFRVCKPGGWVESNEAENILLCDDGSADGVEVLDTWGKLFIESGQTMGRSFQVLTEDRQRKAMEKAGFTNIKVVNYKVPLGGWPRDPKMAEIGRFSRLALENDVEGYTLFLWTQVLKWEYNAWQLFLVQMREMMKNPRIHTYFTQRFVFGQKPLGATSPEPPPAGSPPTAASPPSAASPPAAAPADPPAPASSS